MKRAVAGLIFVGISVLSTAICVNASSAKIFKLTGKITRVITTGAMSGFLDFDRLAEHVDYDLKSKSDIDKLVKMQGKRGTRGPLDIEAILYYTIDGGSVDFVGAETKEFGTVGLIPTNNVYPGVPWNPKNK